MRLSQVSKGSRWDNLLNESTSARRRIIRVFADYGNRWPLWESGADTYTPDPEDLGLSDELAARMREWYDFWELHYHWERGWDSLENQATSLRAGDAFIEQLRGEVATFADVVDGRFRGGARLTLEWRIAWAAHRARTGRRPT